MAHGAGVSGQGALGPFLERLVEQYGRPELLPGDPLAVVHRFADPLDQEVAAVLAAGLAYGRVEQILASVGSALQRMGRPHAFVRGFEPRRDARVFDGWVHRFNQGRDLALLCLGLRQIYEAWGSLGAFFSSRMEPADAHVGPALTRYTRDFLSLDFRPLVVGPLAAGEGVRWFFASPADGSACKRLNLQLRWMVRRDGLDLGLWRDVSPAHLIMPLDTHVARICTYLGLTQRRTQGWAMAQEITEGLRALSPDDPVRYDWAICRLGILNHCPRRRDPTRCAGCTLLPVCRA